MSPSSFIVEVVVENKPLARDPEGETIHHNLILKGGYSQVTNVRAGKFLRMNVEASSEEDAKQLVQKLSAHPTIHNPPPHICPLRVVSYADHHSTPLIPRPALLSSTSSPIDPP